MANHSRRKARGDLERGQAMVEFALILPLLVLTIFASISFLVYYYSASRVLTSIRQTQFTMPAGWATASYAEDNSLEDLIKEQIVGSSALAAERIAVRDATIENIQMYVTPAGETEVTIPITEDADGNKVMNPSVVAFNESVTMVEYGDLTFTVEYTFEPLMSVFWLNGETIELTPPPLVKTVMQPIIVSKSNELRGSLTTDGSELGEAEPEEPAVPGEPEEVEP